MSDYDVIIKGAPLSTVAAIPGILPMSASKMAASPVWRA
jgi:hypothetical protein